MSIVSHLEELYEWFSRIYISTTPFKTVFTRLMDRVDRFEVIKWSLKYCFFVCRKCTCRIQTYIAKNKTMSSAYVKHFYFAGME